MTLKKIKWGNQLIFHSHISGAVQALYFILCTTRRWYTIKIIQARTTLRCFQSSWVIIFLLQVLSMSENFLFAWVLFHITFIPKWLSFFKSSTPVWARWNQATFIYLFRWHLERLCQGKYWCVQIILKVMPEFDWQYNSCAIQILFYVKPCICWLRSLLYYFTRGYTYQMFQIRLIIF